MVYVYFIVLTTETDSPWKPTRVLFVFFREPRNVTSFRYSDLTSSTVGLQAATGLQYKRSGDVTGLASTETVGTERQTDRDRQTETDRQTERQTDRQTETQRKTDRRTNREKDRQTDRQTDRQRQTD